MNTIVENSSDTKSPKSIDHHATTHRAYRKGGCFNMTSVLVAPADRVTPETKVSIANSWLPLSDKAFDMSGPAGYRCPGVIPTLGDRLFTNLAPDIDTYAAQRGWVVQPVMYFFRPQGLVDLIGEDGLIKSMQQINGQLALSERVTVDLTIQTETQSVLADLSELCKSVLSECRYKLPLYCSGDNPRFTLSHLLADFPFLVHHIFHAYPKLEVLRHRGRVNGREEVVSHIRYAKDAVFDLDTEKWFRKNVLTPVA